MEWHVKKSCCHKKAGRLYIVLCDSGGSLKMLAEAQSSEWVKPGDLLSPLKDALYCINRDTSRLIKILMPDSTCATNGNACYDCLKINNLRVGAGVKVKKSSVALP